MVQAVEQVPTEKLGSWSILFQLLDLTFVLWINSKVNMEQLGHSDEEIFDGIFRKTEPETESASCPKILAGAVPISRPESAQAEEQFV